MIAFHPQVSGEPGAAQAGWRDVSPVLARHCGPRGALAEGTDLVLKAAWKNRRSFKSYFGPRRYALAGVRALLHNTG